MTDATSRAAALLGPVGSAARAVWCAAFGAGFTVEALKRNVHSACRAVLQLNMHADFAAVDSRIEDIADAMWHVMRGEAADPLALFEGELDLRREVERLDRECDREAASANALREERDTARAELAAAKERARVATQTLVAEFGAAGPINVEDEAARAVAAHRALRAELASAVADLKETRQDLADSLRADHECVLECAQVRADLARTREQSAALATMVTRLIDADGRVYQSGALCEATPFTKQLRAAANAVLGAGAQGKAEGRDYGVCCRECVGGKKLPHGAYGQMVMCPCSCHRVPADTGEGARPRTLSDPCTHPERNGLHETYVRHGQQDHCRACGARGYGGDDGK